MPGPWSAHRPVGGGGEGRNRPVAKARCLGGAGAIATVVIDASASGECQNISKNMLALLSHFLFRTDVENKKGRKSI